MTLFLNAVRGVRSVVLIAPLVGGAVTVLALSAVGNLQPTGATDPGIAVRVALPVAELCRNLAVAAALGLLVVMGWVLGPKDRVWPRLMDATAAAASMWATAAAVTGLLTFVSATGLAPSDASFSSELIGYLTRIELGRAWGTETVAAGLIAALCLAVRSHSGTLMLLLATVLALLPVLSVGHTVGAGDAPVEVPALVLHVLAAGSWTGGLAVAAVVVSTGQVDPRSTLERYGTVGLVCLVAVSLSGTTLALLHIGPNAALNSPYGLLLLSKVVCLVLAGVLGGFTRVRLLRRLSPMRQRRGIAVVLGAELLALTAAMGVAAALVRTPSPESDVAAAPISTRAEALTGRPLPPSLDALQFAISWRPDVLWVGVAVLLAAGYGVGLARIRRAGGRWLTGRAVAWYCGLVVLVAVTCGAINVYAQVLLPVHVVRTVLLLGVLPLLLVAGGPGRLIDTAAMRRSDGSRGLSEWRHALGVLPAVRWAARPIPAALLVLALVMLLYGTALLRWEAQQLVGHEVLTLALLLAGLLLVTGWKRGPDGRLLSATLLVLGLAGLAMWMVTGAPVGAGWFSALGYPDPWSDQREAGVVLLVALGLAVLARAVVRFTARVAGRQA